MATKKEVWLNNRGEMANCEFDAHRGDAKVETGIKLRVGGVYITRDGRNTIEIFRQADEDLAVADGFSFEGRVIAGSDKKGTTYYYSASGEFNPSNSHPDPDDLTHAVIRADRGTVLPEGVPPELDDWVKRWEWITARVSVDAIKKLGHDDEVRIGTRWFIVWGTDGDYITLVQPAGTALLATDLAAIANEVRYNDR